MARATSTLLSFSNNLFNLLEALAFLGMDGLKVLVFVSI